MALYNFHRVLISSAILFAFGFALYAYREHAAMGRSMDLVMAIVSGAISLAMVGYLIYFNYRIRVIYHHEDRS